MTSRAWWIMLVLTGPLVGLSFINAVRSFSEVSEGAGPGCGAVCAPLIGIWGPTFGAYEIAAIFLLPFVAIRSVAGDRQSGALKLELQRPMRPIARVAAKGIVLLLGWVIAGAAALVAIALWKGYGGAAYPPEILVAALGHLLNAGITIGLAIAIASMTDHPSTAAIITLAITIGTWIVDFAAVISGGIWERLAAYTPAAMVGMFQHGLVQMNVLLIVVTLIGATVAIGAVWIQLGTSVRRRATETLVIAVAAAVLVTGCAWVRGSWDGSESRQNSFAEPEEEALERIREPLAIEVHLSPQDPRRLQFDRGPLAKLRRVMPHLAVGYVARTSSGIYEQQDPGYGEIRYALNGRHASSRAVTDESAIETIFDLAQTAPVDESEVGYRGHPFVGDATGASWLFYGVWPALVGGVGVWMLRRHV